MLDAQPAANAPARPPALRPIPASPAIADTPGVRSKPAALLATATALLPELEAGRALDAKTLREAMSAAFGASDTQGAWVWKDAYEAAEAAMVLFIQRYGRLMRRRPVFAFKTVAEGSVHGQQSYYHQFWHANLE